MRTVTIWFGGDRIDVPAYPTPVPGLVIHAGRGPHEGCWTVTHEASGAGIMRLPEPEAALYAAVRLGALADWLQPGSALRDVTGLDVRVRRLARELDCYSLTFTGGVISDRQLASTEGSAR